MMQQQRVGCRDEPNAPAIRCVSARAHSRSLCIAAANNNKHLALIRTAAEFASLNPNAFLCHITAAVTGSLMKMYG